VGRLRGRLARFALLNLADVTFVVLTKDEEQNLPRMLASVPLAAQLLVIDAQSSDGTTALARSRGANVVVHPWEGFVTTRRFALEFVRTPWTFMLDADEALDAELVRSLEAATPGDGVDGFAVRRATYFCGQPIRYGAWGSDTPLRLFRTAHAQLLAAPAAGGSADVHERWTVTGEIGRLDGTLNHYSYPTRAAYRAKFERYTTLEANGVRGSLVTLAHAGVLVAPRGVWALLRRNGWRDGWRGVYVALASAWYPVVVAWKALRG